MAETLFSLPASYEVREAYHNRFAEGIPHPDRVMEEHDFIYLLEGEWEIFEEGTAYLLRPGDVLLLTAGRRHWGVRPCRDGTRTIYLHVRAPRPSGDEPTPSGGLSLSPFTPCAARPEVLRLFEELAQQFAAPSPVRETRLSALFSLLLAALWEAQRAPSPGADEELAHRAARYLRENSFRFVREKELAAQFFLCPKTLSRRFSAVMGMTPYQYQRRYRLEAARAFLASNPGASLRQAAENFGFCDEFHLSRKLSRRKKEEG